MPLSDCRNGDRQVFTGGITTFQMESDVNVKKAIPQVTNIQKEKGTVWREGENMQEKTT